MVNEQYIAVNNRTGMQTAIFSNLDTLLTVTHGDDYTISKVVPLNSEIEKRYHLKRGDGKQDFLNLDTDDDELSFNDDVEEVGFRTKFTLAEIMDFIVKHQYINFSQLQLVRADD